MSEVTIRDRDAMEDWAKKAEKGGWDCYRFGYEIVRAIKTARLGFVPEQELSLEERLEILEQARDDAIEASAGAKLDGLAEGPSRSSPVIDNRRPLSEYEVLPEPPFHPQTHKPGGDK